MTRENDGWGRGMRMGRVDMDGDWRGSRVVGVHAGKLPRNAGDTPCLGTSRGVCLSKCVVPGTVKFFPGRFVSMEAKCFHPRFFC